MENKEISKTNLIALSISGLKSTDNYIAKNLAANYGCTFYHTENLDSPIPLPKEYKRKIENEKKYLAAGLYAGKHFPNSIRIIITPEEEFDGEYNQNSLEGRLNIDPKEDIIINPIDRHEHELITIIRDRIKEKYYKKHKK